MPVIRDWSPEKGWHNRMIEYKMPTKSATDIEVELYKRLEEYSVEKYPAEHRHHLGISVIGEECWRKLWNSFRWLKLEQAEGRMRRLWATGHKKEKEIRDFLLWAGFHFRGIDPKTDKPYRLSLIENHYGGEPDDITLIAWLDDFPVLCEYKTHNDKSFKELREKKVKLAKPQHWSQMCGYGKYLEIKNALYIGVNKNDEHWHFEFLELDGNVSIELEKKATDIIYAKTPPQKINENPSYWRCKSCNFKEICHEGKPVEKNCRSCVFASPIDGGEWACEKYGPIPREFIVKGCGEWKSIV